MFEIAVKDKDVYNNNFLKDAQKLIADHGGKYVAGGYDKTVSFSGTSLPNRVGILQFANMDAAKAWQDGGGRDIQEKVGSKYADFRVYAVEGVERNNNERAAGCASGHRWLLLPLRRIRAGAPARRSLSDREGRPLSGSLCRLGSVRARVRREETMRFMVEIDAGMEKANAIDAGGGPGIPAPSQLITATALTRTRRARFSAQAAVGPAL